MVPPFLAFYGVMSRNRTLLEDAYTQIKLYRNYLLDTSANNLWKHIVMGSSGTDDGHWSTGMYLDFSSVIVPFLVGISTCHTTLLDLSQRGCLSLGR